MAEPTLSQLLGLDRQMGRIREHPPSKCGHCRKSWTASAGPVEQRLPEPGMFTICMYCLGVCQYDEQLQGRALHAKQLRQLPRAFRRKLEEMRESLRALQQRQCRIRRSVGETSPA